MTSGRGAIFPLLRLVSLREHKKIVTSCAFCSCQKRKPHTFVCMSFVALPSENAMSVVMEELVGGRYDNNESKIRLCGCELLVGI